MVLTLCFLAVSLKRTVHAGFDPDPTLQKPKQTNKKSCVSYRLKLRVPTHYVK